MSNDYKTCPFAKELRVQGVFGEPSQTVGWLCSAVCDKCPARNPLRHGYNSVFNQITQSPEVLAENFVEDTMDGTMFYSILTREDYCTKERAIAATVAKLKETKLYEW